MKPDQILKALEERGALLRGHFKLSSGRHSDTYVQKQMILSFPRVAAQLGQAIADRFADSKFETVLSAGASAVLLGYMVAMAADARFVFAEREEGAMRLRRSQRLVPGERVLIVEDIVTTGGSVAEVIAVAEDAQADVQGVVALVDRTNVALGFKLDALLRLEAVDWSPDECPLCRDGVALDSPGSRYLA